MSLENPGQDLSEVPKSFLTSAVYDRLKFVVQYIMPAAATLYAGLAVLWDFPHGTQVVGTISLVTVFLAAILGISNASFNKSVAAVEAKKLETPTVVNNYAAPLEGTSQANKSEDPTAFH